MYIRKRITAICLVVEINTFNVTFTSQKYIFVSSFLLKYYFNIKISLSVHFKTYGHTFWNKHVYTVTDVIAFITCTYNIYISLYTFIIFICIKYRYIMYSTSMYIEVSYLHLKYNIVTLEWKSKKIMCT